MVIKLSLRIAVVLLFAVPSFAQDQESSDSAAEMARKLQDPLASIFAIVTDNDILFKTGDDETQNHGTFRFYQGWPTRYGGRQGW